MKIGNATYEHASTPNVRNAAQRAAPQIQAPRPNAPVQRAADISGDSAVLAPVSRPRILPTGSVFGVVEAALDLSHRDGSLHSAYAALEPDEQAEALAILARLLKQGIVGQETLEVAGEPRTTFATTRLGDPTLRRARPWPDDTGSRLDVRA